MRLFIFATLQRCPSHRLADVVREHEVMWMAAWRAAGSMDHAALHVLLSALARLPVAKTQSLAPLQLSTVVAVVTTFLDQAKSGARQEGQYSGLAAHDVKLKAIEVAEKVFQRLIKFTWDMERGDVLGALSDVLVAADQLIELRQATHRKARDRLAMLFEELEKPWAIRTTTKSTAVAVAEAEDDGTPAWTRPTVAWLSDWTNFQPRRLPKMKVPGGRGDVF
ncbi:hypothetical protein PINS_up008163 [Pythium insidiosum]|nr:hypothetical protein PINS_up008163 [Pythium insidiosum]